MAPIYPMETSEGNNINEIQGTEAVNKSKKNFSMDTYDSYNDDLDIRTSHLYSSLQWLLRSMIVCGQFTTRAWSPKTQFNTKKKQSWSTIISRGYSTTVLIILWLHILRVFSVFVGPNSFDSLLFAKVTLLSWCSVCVLGCTVMYAACNQQDNNIWKFLHEWQMLSSSQCVSCVKRHTSRYAVIGWILVAINQMFGLYAFWQTELFDMVLMPAQLFLGDTGLFWFRIFNSVTMFYLLAAWIFPLIFFYTISSVLYHNFRLHCAEMAQESNASNYCLPYQAISNYRRKHNGICKLLDTADGMLHFYVGSTICMKTVMVCVLLYNIIWYTEYLLDPVVMTMNVFWLLSGFTIMCVIAVGGALVNHVVSPFVHYSKSGVTQCA
jgi:hypothetical protein